MAALITAKRNECIEFNVGEILKVKEIKISYKWNIEGFIYLDQPTGKCISSRVFSPALSKNLACKWCLHLYPNGFEEEDKDYVAIFVVVLSLTRNLRVNWRMSIFNTKDVLVKTDSFIHEYIKNGKDNTDNFGFANFIERERLIGENFYILCEISFLDKFITVQREADVAVASVGNRAIAQDLKSLSDVVLRVDEIDLPAHKVLLAIESPVFRAMFESDTVENHENVVNIVDFDVDTIREMLTYIYTGTAPNVENMVGSLLVVADKYDMPGLKKICEQELSQKLCLNNFCETFLLSELHNTCMLKEACIEYFYFNAANVCGSSEWNTFKQAHANIAVNLLDVLFIPMAKKK